MTASLALHSAVTWAMVGVIWTIQRVHYPLFTYVGEESFEDYHAEHLWYITWIVAPLALAEFLTAGWLLLTGLRNVWFLISLIPMVVNWVMTMVIIVPMHLRLGREYDADLVRRIMGWNWVRTVGWTARAVCLLIAVL